MPSTARAAPSKPSSKSKTKKTTAATVEFELSKLPTLKPYHEPTYDEILIDELKYTKHLLAEKVYYYNKHDEEVSFFVDGNKNNQWVSYCESRKETNYRGHFARQIRDLQVVGTIKEVPETK